MGGLELVLLLLAVSAALRVLAERLTIPYAALLVVGGALLALIPGVPRVTPAPDVLFLVFVPPLLYAGATAFPVRSLRRQLGPIIRLAVLLVLVSTAAVAVVAHALHPAFTWAAAITLGAIVSPPDPVAVLSVTRSLRVPRDVENILEGEGLMNDATALVIYRLAVAAAVTSTFSASRAALDFLLAGSGGIAIGLVIGAAMVQLQRLMRSVPTVTITLSLLSPFASFLPAELVGASGVLAVVTTGMYVSSRVPQVIGPETRVLLIGAWTVVTFLLESLIFILVGLELRYVLQALNRFPLATLMREAAIISLCVVLVRIVWVPPSAYLFRVAGRWLRGSHEPLPSLRLVFFVAWAGLRGGDSLVLALALPLTTNSGARFPAREQIVFITFAVILITLVVQGSTLHPLVRWLRLSGSTERDAESTHARLTAAEAGLRVLDDAAVATSDRPEVVRYLKRRQRQRARRWAVLERDSRTHDSSSGTQLASDGDGHFVSAPSARTAAIDDRRTAEYRRIRGAMLRAEREAVVELRERGVIADDVMRQIRRDLDIEAMLLQTSEPVIDTLDDVPAALDDIES